jgi:hypothetical protein
MRLFVFASTIFALVAALTGCSARPQEPATSDNAALSADAGVRPFTFREIEKILARTCGSCHEDEFTRLADVKKDREIMIRKIEGGEMPADQDDWLDTANGKAVLEYLKTSPELR